MLIDAIGQIHPVRMMVGDADAAHRRHILDPETKMRAAQRSGLHEVLEILTDTREQELKAGSRKLWLHRDLFPAACPDVAGTKLRPGREAADRVHSDELISVSADGRITRTHAQRVVRPRGCTRPQRERAIAKVARA